MDFYSYLWLRKDGTPYYAGKGKGDRAFHISGHVVKPPKDRSRILIFVRKSEQEAFDTERELIRNWGRKDLETGCLRNMTDGGDGPAGFVRSAEMNRKVSESKKGSIPWNKGKIGVQVASVDARQHMSESRKGKPLSATHKANIALSLAHRNITWGSRLSEAKQKSAPGDVLAGNHIRWHLNRNKISSRCALCTAA